MFLLLQPLALMPFDRDTGIDGPQDSTTAVDSIEEIRERRNARKRQGYAARVAAKAASRAQEDADRVTAEAAAAWRRVHLAEGRRDRYHKKKIAKTIACPSGPTESSLIFNNAAAQVVTTIAQESTSAADLAVAQEEADRVTSETAALGSIFVYLGDNPS